MQRRAHPAPDLALRAVNADADDAFILVPPMQQIEERLPRGHASAGHDVQRRAPVNGMSRAREQRIRGEELAEPVRCAGIDHVEHIVRARRQDPSDLVALGRRPDP
jgi:hypothetical protein